MKKLILLLFLIIPVYAFSQGLSGFLKPVDNYTFQKKLSVKAVTDGTKTDMWLLRPSFTMTAGMILYDPADKQYKASALSGGGLGISYAHYIESNGEPFNNYGASALLLLNWSINDQVQAHISPAITINYMKLFSTGAGYLTGPADGRNNWQRIFFMQNITYSF